MKKQYVYSFDGDYYDSDLYDTRKEAINAGIKEAKKEKYLYFYLGTATVNLLLLTGLTNEDFDKHIEKLNDYKNGKYKKEKIKE